MRLWIGLLALVSIGVRPHAQRLPDADYIAFRVDAERLIATVLARDVTPPQIREGLSPPPVARYGYPHFPVPSWWRERGPFDVPQTDRWVVHVSPREIVDAVAEDVVGGHAFC